MEGTNYISDVTANVINERIENLLKGFQSRETLLVSLIQDNTDTHRALVDLQTLFNSAVSGVLTASLPNGQSNSSISTQTEEAAEEQRFVIHPIEVSAKETQTDALKEPKPPAALLKVDRTPKKIEQTSDVIVNGKTSRKIKTAQAKGSSTCENEEPFSSPEKVATISTARQLQNATKLASSSTKTPKRKAPMTPEDNLLGFKRTKKPSTPAKPEKFVIKKYDKEGYRIDKEYPSERADIVDYTNASQPTEENLTTFVKRESTKSTMICALPNCYNLVQKPSDGNILCESCHPWIHYNCVSQKVYDPRTGTEECMFCNQQRLMSPVTEIQMEDSLESTVEIVERPVHPEHQDEAPKGSRDDWKWYWNLVSREKRNIKVGDSVYIQDNQNRIRMVFVELLLRDAKKRPFAKVMFYEQPENCSRHSKKRFFKNEVLMRMATEKEFFCELADIVGPPVCVLREKHYTCYRPRGVLERDVYIERDGYDLEGEEIHRLPNITIDYKMNVDTNLFAFREFLNRPIIFPSNIFVKDKDPVYNFETKVDRARFFLRFDRKKSNTGE